jgi:hypothetical protein
MLRQTCSLWKVVMPDFAWNFASDSGTNGCGSNIDLLGVELEWYIVMGGNSNWGKMFRMARNHYQRVQHIKFRYVSIIVNVQPCLDDHNLGFAEDDVVFSQLEILYDCGIYRDH